jgi:hypothetical protein
MMLILVLSTAARADVVRTPISGGEFSGHMSSCLLQGGTRPPFTDHIPAMCCATNEEGTRWCVTCFGGTADNPKDCSITTPGRKSKFNVLRPPAPGNDVLAPEPGTTAPMNTPMLRLQTGPLIIAPIN